MKYLIDTDAQHRWLYSARSRVQIGAVHVLLLGYDNYSEDYDEMNALTCGHA